MTLKESRRILEVCALVCALAALGLAGCRDTGGGGGNNGSGDEPDAGEGLGAGMSIQEVQSDAVAEGDEVTLREVVVTAIDTFGGRTGSVYVMEPEGGERSGIQIFLQGTEGAGLSPGDLVDVEGGVKEEFSFDADESGRSLTQLRAPQGGEVELTAVGEGEVPEPERVDPAALAADDELARDWQSVLVEVEAVAVERGVEEINAGDELFDMVVTGSLAVVSQLTALGDEIEEGDCYASITGILGYAFDYQLMPRTPGDFAAGEEGDCPAPGDLFTVRELKQEEGVEEGDAVRVEEVVVTGVAADDQHFFVQDAIEDAEPFNGIYVFRGGGADSLPDAIEIGSVVDLVGELGSFHGASQIQAAGGGDVFAAIHDGSEDPIIQDDPPPLGDLAAIEEGESYEHVLVELADLEVASEPGDFGAFEVTDGDDDLLVDDFVLGDEFFDAYFDDEDVDVGDCFGRIRGVMDRTEFGDNPERRIYPRSEDDLELGGECDG